MSLKDCKECGKEVSDKAVQCPHCGLPILAEDQLAQVGKVALMILIPFIAGLIGLMLVS